MLHNFKFYEPVVFNGFDNIKNDNSVIWEACKKELPNIMAHELTEQQKACIEGIFFENLNQVQVAKKLGISQPTASRHIKRGMEKLLNRLNYALRVAKTVTSYYENGGGE